MPTRPTVVLIGQVLVGFDTTRPQTAEAIGIADGRVVMVGRADELRRAAAPSAQIENFGTAAIVPGIHDFHLHLVGMARARRDVPLDEVERFADLLAAVDSARQRAAEGEWLRGGGWSERLLGEGNLADLAAACGSHPAILYSHDRHSIWASPPALAAAGVFVGSVDPAGGRIEHDVAGALTGVLRERAADSVEAVAGRLGGPALQAELGGVLHELAALGITGATDAGDTTDENGVGAFASLGDRASELLAARGMLDGRLRLTVNLPVAAIEAVQGLGLRSGSAIPDTTTLRLGWAKVYLDGALGSRTAAVKVPYPGTDATGILRLEAGELAVLLRDARGASVPLAIHAIGDRAVSSALDALRRDPRLAPGSLPDRIEHLQLVADEDIRRISRLDVTASVQPIHAASDRALVEEAWVGQRGIAYPWRSIAAAGGRLAFGSDAPIESANPWLGVFAAVHRRFPGDGTPDWRPEQALSVTEALAAYTSGPAAAAGRDDEGHLRPGAVADLAVLNVDAVMLMSADDRLADVRAQLTLVGGLEVHRS